MHPLSDWPSSSICVKWACLQVTLFVEQIILVHEPCRQWGKIWILYLFKKPCLRLFFFSFTINCNLEQLKDFPSCSIAQQFFKNCHMDQVRIVLNIELVLLTRVYALGWDSKVSYSSLHSLLLHSLSSDTLNSLTVLLDQYDCSGSSVMGGGGSYKVIFLLRGGGSYKVNFVLMFGYEHWSLVVKGYRLGEFYWQTSITMDTESPSWYSGLLSWADSLGNDPIDNRNYIWYLDSKTNTIIDNNFIFLLHIQLQVKWLQYE